MPLCYTLFVFSIVAGSVAVKSEVACKVCGVLHDPQMKWCPSCSKILGRIDTRAKHNKNARLAALKRAWGGSAFYCEITGWRLTTTDRESPFYLTWEHLTPGNEKKVVVAAALVNRMKVDLTLQRIQAAGLCARESLCQSSVDGPEDTAAALSAWGCEDGKADVSCELAKGGMLSASSREHAELSIGRRPTLGFSWPRRSTFAWPCHPTMQMGAVV